MAFLFKTEREMLELLGDPYWVLDRLSRWAGREAACRDDARSIGDAMFQAEELQQKIKALQDAVEATEATLGRGR
jgi:hypothetical protein